MLSLLHSAAHSVATESLPFSIDASDRAIDPWGVGVIADPVLRSPKAIFASPEAHKRLEAGDRRLLLSRGELAHRAVLNTTTAALLRRRLRMLESSLSKLPHSDLRWCHRYCKNMFFFAPALRAFAHTVGSAFAQQLGSQQLYLMNDEVSYNVYGEPHFDGWHLDTNAWQSLPPDAWAWTIYIPLDEGSVTAGGGWLRFRDRRDPTREFDDEFERGDILVFDRWIWHRLVDFTRQRKPRLAYILRVTNDTRFAALPLSPKYQPPLRRVLPFPVGWQINYYCSPHPSHPRCRPPLLGEHPESNSYQVSTFEINISAAIDSTRTDCLADPKLAGRWRSEISLDAKRGPFFWLAKVRSPPSTPANLPLTPTHPHSPPLTSTVSRRSSGSRRVRRRGARPAA